MFDYPDKIRLIKSDGSSIDNISAMAQPGLICIPDEKVPVEDNDIIERRLPNGIIERWTVIDPGYYGKHPGFPAYQCKVKKASQVVKPIVQSIVYNINGYNAKVNINSHDESVNSVNINPDEVFDKLIDVINTNIQNSTEIVNLVNEMRNEKGEPSFLQKYQNFIASVANHVSVIAPFIPALTQMIM